MNVTVTGKVDTTTDTFTIDSWTNGAGARTWAPVPSSLPWDWPAVTGATCDTYDIPDNWDCTIGDDWGFIDASDLRTRQWEQGTWKFSDTMWVAWGASAGSFNRCGTANYSWGETRFEGAPNGESGTQSLSFTKLVCTPPSTGPGFDKAFSPDTIANGGTSTLTFTIDNTGNAVDATSLDFTDDLPTGVTVADPANASTTCTSGTLSAPAGSGSISYTAGTAAAGSTCTVQADVTSTTSGAHNNTTGDLTSSLGNSGTASDTLTVADVPPGFSKAFSPDTIVPDGTSTLTFTIDNTGSLVDATSLDFTDDLPSGVTVADPANASTTCTGGTLKATAGSGSISYTDGTLAAGATCTVQADVTSSTPDSVFTNTTGDLTSSLGNSGTASDTLNVGPAIPDAPTATSATDVTETSFSANWHSSRDLTGYRLDVATDNGFTSFVTGFNDKDLGNVTTFSVTGLSGGTDYYYRVRAENTSGASPNSNTIQVTTTDGTGVPYAVQDAAPNNGDGNGDGIKDKLQTNVASLPSATEAGSYLTVAIGGGCGQLQSVAAVTYASVGQVDPGYEYPLELVEFNIPCGTATVRIYYHGAAGLEGYIYRKYGPTPADWAVSIWYDMPGVTFGSKKIGKATVPYVEFVLTEAQLGDDTPVFPIIDQGGLAAVVNPVIPTLNEWGLMALALVMTGMALWVMRRKRTRKVL